MLRSVRWQCELSRPKKTLITVAFFSVALVYFTLHHQEPQEWPLASHPRRKIEINITKSIIDRNRRIFFHETSGNGSLSIRQCCTVESMAKHNPTLPVHVYLSAERLNTTDPWLSVLQHYPNVATFVVNNGEYFTLSRLKDWYDQGAWKLGTDPVYHLSEYLRLVTLYREGGFYMDLDYVALKPLDEKFFQNVLFLESGNIQKLTNSVAHFRAQHKLIDKIVQRLSEGFSSPNFNDSDIITEMYQEHCIESTPGNDDTHEFVLRKSEMCSDIRVLAAKHFTPIGSSQWRTLFETATTQSLSMLQDSYAARLWSILSHDEPIRFATNQLYAVLAEMNCPITSASYTNWTS